MGRMHNAAMLLFSLLAVSLAGCAESPPGDDTGDDGPRVDATSTTGGIRGVIVDEAIVPVEGATVQVVNTEHAVETDTDGSFVFSGLPPGTYFVEATHPLYDTQQISTEVEADVETPPAVKIQLTRVITNDPYLGKQVFKGFVACSANILIPSIGGLLFEECGEGVGVPGFGRVGKNPDNQAQIDFFLDGPQVKTLIAEAVWEPSVAVGVSGTGQTGGFNMGIYADFVCDPACEWTHQVDRKDSHSPMYLRSNDTEGFDGDVPLSSIDITPETRFSTFTWASSEETGVLLQQSLEVFVSASYVLPLPPEWSLVEGDENPF